MGFVGHEMSPLAIVPNALRPKDTCWEQFAGGGEIARRKRANRQT